MSELINREALLDECLNHYEVGNIEQNCTMDWICKTVRNFPAASPWHRVEDELPEMRELVPCYVRSEILVLHDAETGYMDIGYVRQKPDNNGVDWLWGLPRKTPTHWMPIEPPKEEANANK